MEKREKQEVMKRVQVDLPEPLHKRFKIACNMQDVSMSKVLADYVEEWLKKNELKPWMK
ncbi:TPA: hypothetical protein RFV54_003722 [Klebsiella aerogenes]|nr:hypothetical protein [Klebsiella aerogenes]